MAETDKELILLALQYVLENGGSIRVNIKYVVGYSRNENRAYIEGP